MSDLFKPSRSRHPLQRLIEYSQPYRVQVRLAILASIFNKIFDLAPPALIGAAVDVVVQQENSWLAQFGIQDTYTQLAILSGLSAIIWIFESGFEYGYARLWRNLAQSIQHRLRLDAYQHLQELELGYFEERSTGGVNVHSQR